MPPLLRLLMLRESGWDGERVKEDWEKDEAEKFGTLHLHRHVSHNHLTEKCRTLSRLSSAVVGATKSKWWIQAHLHPQNIRNSQWQTSSHVIYKHKYILNINRNLFSAPALRTYSLTFHTLQILNSQNPNVFCCCGAETMVYGWCVVTCTPL